MHQLEHVALASVAASDSLDVGGPRLLPAVVLAHRQSFVLAERTAYLQEKEAGRDS